MKEYIKPTINVSKLDVEDVITISGLAPWNEGGEGDGISRPGEELFLRISTIFGEQ